MRRVKRRLWGLKRRHQILLGVGVLAAVTAGSLGIARAGNPADYYPYDPGVFFKCNNPFMAQTTRGQDPDAHPWNNRDLALNLEDGAGNPATGPNFPDPMTVQFRVSGRDWRVGARMNYLLCDSTNSGNSQQGSFDWNWTNGRVTAATVNNVSVNGPGACVSGVIWADNENDSIGGGAPQYDYFQICASDLAEAWTVGSSLKEGVGTPFAGPGATIGKGGTYGVDVSTFEVSGTKATDQDIYTEVVASDRPPNQAGVNYYDSTTIQSVAISPGGSYIKEPPGIPPLPLTPANGPNGHWSWLYRPPNVVPLTPGVRAETFSFKITNAFPEGATLCLSVYSKRQKASDAGSFSSAPCNLQWTVPQPSSPWFDVPLGAGAGADVHADGEVFPTGVSGNQSSLGCNHGNDLLGKISGRSSDVHLSRTPYLVSAGGPVVANTTDPFYPGYRFSSGFGSNSLTLGHRPAPGFSDFRGSGRYGYICRPDIAAKIAQVLGDGSGFFPYGGVLFAGFGNQVPYQANVATCAAPCHLGAGNPTVITNRFTIYSPGDIFIDGDIINSNNPARRDQLPSVAIVAGGNITISHNVGRIDGYVITGINADLRTCGPPVAGVSSAGLCAVKPLLVNGVLMGGNIFLNRTGGTDVKTPGGTPAEQINFNGLLYITAPPGLDDLNGQFAIRPNYYGETPPKY